MTVYFTKRDSLARILKGFETRNNLLFAVAEIFVLSSTKGRGTPAVLMREEMT